MILAHSIQTISSQTSEYVDAAAIKLRDLVIPAQAGIHPRFGLCAIGEMDPRLRGDDSFSLT